jgi:hypothetical protein
MHSKVELMDFYGGLGFYPIREDELPKTIRDRFAFCLGELKGIDVCPMKRDPATPCSRAGILIWRRSSRLLPFGENGVVLPYPISVPQVRDLGCPHEIGGV